MASALAPPASLYLCFAMLLSPGASFAGEPPISLEQALELARASNAKLPVADLNSQIANQAVAKSKAMLGPRVFLTGSAPYTPHSLTFGPGNSVGEDSLLLIARQPLYLGHTLRSQIKADQHRLISAKAGYRVIELDLELEVRSRFSEVLLYQSNAAAQTNGIARIQTYLKMIQARKASGQGLESDLLKAQVRLDEVQALLDEARRSLAEAQMELNVLMGRAPDEPLELMTLPAPTVIPEFNGANLSNLPDVASAVAERDAAMAEVSVARGAYLPHVNLFMKTGLVDPGIGLLRPDPSFDQRVRGDYGAAIGVDISWDIWSSGAYRAQISQAQLVAEKATASILVTQRQAGLEYARARADLALWFREFQTRSHQLTLARSSYVAAESLYRGGRGSALGVLDAFDSLINVELNQAQSLFQTRLAEARLLRRGGS